MLLWYFVFAGILFLSTARVPNTALALALVLALVLALAAAAAVVPATASGNVTAASPTWTTARLPRPMTPSTSLLDGSAASKSVAQESRTVQACPGPLPEQIEAEDAPSACSTPKPVTVAGFQLCP